MEHQCVLVRYDEIALKKGRIRTMFEKTLEKNIIASLKNENIDVKIRRDRGRLFFFGENPEKIAKIISTVFGVASCSVAEICETSIPVILEKGLEVAKKMITPGHSFAIRSRRSGNHDFTSLDIARDLGDVIIKNINNLTVDLKNPDYELFVEVRQTKTYFFSTKFDGYGGLPLSTQGKTVVLISGGIDSPVAAWMMMKRGILPVFVHCDLYPFTDERARKKALNVVKKLKKYMRGHTAKVYVVKHGENMKIVTQSAPRNLSCVMCKRLMYRMASRIADKEKALSIVTGESLGQVASQTSENLFVESKASPYPIYRPLIGLNKKEIETIAKKIGTFETSTDKAACCEAVPPIPEKKADINVVEDEEQFLEIHSLVASAFKSADIIKIDDREEL